MADFGHVPPLKHCLKERGAAISFPCEKRFGLYLLGLS